MDDYWYRAITEYMIKLDDEKLSYIIDLSWGERVRRNLGRMDSILVDLDKELSGGNNEE